jgi:hypothetical protein
MALASLQQVDLFGRRKDEADTKIALQTATSANRRLQCPQLVRID